MTPWRVSTGLPAASSRALEQQHGDQHRGEREDREPQPERMRGVGSVGVGSVASGSFGSTTPSSAAGRERLSAQSEAATGVTSCGCIGLWQCPHTSTGSASAPAGVVQLDRAATRR